MKLLRSGTSVRRPAKDFDTTQWTEKEISPEAGWIPGQYCLCRRLEGVGLTQATYVFDPGTFVQDEKSKQMRYGPTVADDRRWRRGPLLGLCARTSDE
jgi:hypothetical protein